MLSIISALIPVFLIIAIGWLIRRIGFPDNAMWAPLERLVYFVLFPCLILQTLATADLGGINVWPMAGALLASIFAMAGILGGLRTRVGLNGAQYSSLFQGAVRWNGFVGLAAAANLYGSAGVALMAIAIACMVPTVNLLSIYVLTRHANSVDANMRGALLAVARNPLILACVLGIALNASGLGLTSIVEQTIDVLGGAALPLGLLAVGAALDLSHAAKFSRTIALGAALKMIGMPLLVATATWLLGVHGITREIAILCAAVPGATSSYILAKQLGGDGALMAGLITATTVGALITMPLVLILLI